VRRVLDPMIAGQLPAVNSLSNDVAYVAGLGLIRVVDGGYAIANPIYREIIPRAMTEDLQRALDQKTAWRLRPDGLLDVPKLMAAWQEFWREDGHEAADGFVYK
jgi:hypothetical protein